MAGVRLDEVGWRQVDALFDAALERRPGEREAFLARECPDPRTRELVARLLARAEEADDFLRPGGAAAGPFVAELAAALGLVSELAPGTRIGPYEVLGLLGEGGMGKVYRARDTQLEREVAVKTLPVAGAGQGERLQRFAREARLLARLNHPQVGAIYGLAELDGQPFLILELVEGPTLGEHLAAGALRPERAVEIALGIAAALEEAHAKGIVHRDLTPGNVKLAPGGVVKVLDFGLAKLLPEAPQVAGDPGDGTLTAAGLVLGTAAYMSPEQARGQTVDERTDIWAFGCLLFEMLAGSPAFARPTGAETLAAIVGEEPAFGRLPPATPPALRRLVRRCLAKDPRRRLRDVGDARIELSEWREGPPDDGGRAPAATIAPRRSARSRAAALLPWLLAALAAAALLVRWSTPEPPRPPDPTVRLTLEPGPGVELPADYDTLAVPSPDGSQVVFCGESEGTRRLWVRPLGSLAARPLEGTEGAKMPFFSPDGRWVGFFAGRKLRKVPLAGGTVIDLVEVGGNPRGASWGADDTIVLAPSQASGLATVSAAGGPLEPLTRLDPELWERSHRWPQVLPGGRGVLYTAQSEGTSFDEARIAVLPAGGGAPEVVIGDAAHGVYLATGHLAFVRAGRLFVVPFDLDRLETSGEAPALALAGVRYDPRNGGAQFAVSDTGTLVYRPGAPIATDNRPVWVDRQGGRTRLQEEARVFGEPRLSPGGQRVLLRIGTGGESGLWLLDLPNHTLSRLTFIPSVAPVWAPDGRSIAFAAPHPGQLNLFGLRLEPGAQPVALSASPNRQIPLAFAPGGRTLVYQERRPGSGWDLLALDLDAGGEATGEPRELLATPFNETNAAFSPDGRFLAYASDELDSVVEIYVRSYPDLAEKWRASTGGARRPVWRPDGRELYYWKTGDQALVAVAYRTRGGRFELGEEQVLLAAGESLWRVGLEGGVMADPSTSGFDVAAGGQRFLLLEPETVDEAPQSEGFVVVLNWFGELPRGARADPAR
jgi:Tol biopolymer transport system component